jgi:hypothetical protein
MGMACLQNDDLLRSKRDNQRRKFKAVCFYQSLHKGKATRGAVK